MDNLLKIIGAVLVITTLFYVTAMIGLWGAEEGRIVKTLQFLVFQMISLGLSLFLFVFKSAPSSLLEELYQEPSTEEILDTIEKPIDAVGGFVFYKEMFFWYNLGLLLSTFCVYWLRGPSHSDHALTIGLTVLVAVFGMFFGVALYVRD